MFLKLLLISIFFVSLVIAGLAIRMLIKRNANFPETHISRNPEMQKRGISCAQKTDLGCNPSDNNISCCSCSVREN
jgi:hypothetical protein